MKTKKRTDLLMQDADEVFWDQLDALEGRGERYLVVDSARHEVVADGVKLVGKKKARV